MYSPMCCPKGYRQGVKNNFAQREIEFLRYVVTKEVGDKQEEYQGNPKEEFALDSKTA